LGGGGGKGLYPSNFLKKYYASEVGSVSILGKAAPELG